MLTLFILLAELIGSTVALVWITAMLGFADEMHRSQKASVLGKVIAFMCMITACFPLIMTGWLGWKYYFSDTLWSDVPFGWWLHVIVSLVCFPACWGMIYLYDASYKGRV